VRQTRRHERWPGCALARLRARAGEQRFAIIGDYGLSEADEASVATLVAKVRPDFVVTTGDNNYPLGGADTIDENVGRYFHAFIAPYIGSFGGGASVNRFFPSLGNHDWDTQKAQPYLDYFSLPNNERYYDTTIGSVQLFAVDSDPNEPDGTDADSVQAHWLEARLEASRAPWKVVYFHHPPYSSGPHGSSPGMRWPFREWGASIVYSGHDHTYERLSVAGFPFIVNGVGGSCTRLSSPFPRAKCGTLMCTAWCS
jgi:tartrate-resistant acid phosphatase type 5